MSSQLKRVAVMMAVVVVANLGVHGQGSTTDPNKDTKDEIYALIKAYDNNPADGQLSQAEFNKYMATTRNKELNHFGDELFREITDRTHLFLDRDGDKQVNPTDLFDGGFYNTKTKVLKIILAV